MAQPYTLECRVTLARDPGGRLQGTLETAAPDAIARGPLGRTPSVRLEGGWLHIESAPEERPRWWMSGRRKTRCASVKRVSWNLGATFLNALAREGDTLRLAYDANACPTLILRRGAHPLAGWGSREVLDEFTVATRQLRPADIREGESMQLGTVRLTCVRGPRGMDGERRWCAFRADGSLPTEEAEDFLRAFAPTRFEMVLW